MISYPITAFIEVTSKCNLACKHCYNNSGEDNLCDFEYEKLIDIIKDFEQNYVATITISGGEPLLYNKIWETLNYIKNNTKMKVALNSNGLMLNEQNIDRLISLNVKDIQISLDGLKNTHEKIRGKDTFDKTVANIVKCVNRGIRVKIGYTINALNYNDIEEVIKLAIDIGVSSIAFYRFVPTSKRDFNRVLDINAELLKYISQNLIYLQKKYSQNRFLIYFEPLSFFSFLHNNKYLSKSKCLAGEGQINFSTSGELLLCSHNRISCGTVKSRDVKTLWEVQNKYKN